MKRKRGVYTFLFSKEKYQKKSAVSQLCRRCFLLALRNSLQELHKKCETARSVFCDIFSKNENTIASFEITI